MSKFLTACFAGVAAAVAVAEDLAINVAADQTATYDQDANVKSVTIAAGGTVELTGDHTYTNAFSTAKVGDGSVFTVRDGAKFLMKQLDVIWGLNGDFSLNLQDATLSAEARQSLVGGTLSQVDENDFTATLTVGGENAEVIVATDHDSTDSDALYTRNRTNNNAQNGNIGLFAACSKEKGSTIAAYSFKMWNEAGTLIRDFVPCRRLSDGVLGMYDLSDHSGEPEYCPFYTNSWDVSNPFTAPQTACGEAPAPGFERLAWIKANGKQMIDTKTGAAHVELVFNADKWAADKVLFGNAWSQNRYTVAYATHGGSKLTQFSDNVNYNLGSIDDWRDYKITVYYSGATTRRAERLLLASGTVPQSLAAGLTMGEPAGNGPQERLVSNGTNSGGGWGNSKSLTVFGAVEKGYGSSVAALCSTIALYSMQVYSNGNTVIVRDLVPARRTSDGKLGLYDLADHSNDPGYDPFYVDDLNPTVPFVAPETTSGPAPAPGFERLAWIKSTGKQRIQLGMPNSAASKIVIRFNTLNCGSGKVITGYSFSQNYGCVCTGTSFTWYSGNQNKGLGTCQADTDYQLTLASSSGSMDRVYQMDVPMAIRFAPPAENFAAAPVRSTAHCRGIVIGDATKIEVVEPDGVQFVKIPLISDVGGFAGSPLNAAKLATLTANATLPKGMELWYRESDKTLYARRKQGLLLIVQ
mgnify:CR=1 FL=1